jgi:hypothetical protein
MIPLFFCVGLLVRGVPIPAPAPQPFLSNLLGLMGAAPSVLQTVVTGGGATGATGGAVIGSAGAAVVPGTVVATAPAAMMAMTSMIPAVLALAVIKAFVIGSFTFMQTYSSYQLLFTAKMVEKPEKTKGYPPPPSYGYQPQHHGHGHGRRRSFYY